MSSEAGRPKKLGPWACAALVVGNMVGSGVYLLPASLAPYGGLSIVAWLFTAGGSICLALVFAELAGLVPRAGGPYAYTREGYGDFAAFWVAWGYWIAIWSGNAALAVAFASYLSVFVPALAKSTFLSGLVAIAAVWTVVLVNCRGVHAAGKLQIVTTVIKLVPLLVIATIGFFWADLGNLLPLNPSGQPVFAAVSSAATLTLWAFLGLESATVPAGDVENPTRNIPRATILGTLVAAAIYIFGTVAVMGVVPQAVLAKSTAPFADAARIMWGDAAYYLVGFGAVVSCLGTLNGWILMLGQVPKAAADDGLFPSRFAAVNRHGVPAFGTMVSSLLITFLLSLNYSGARTLLSVFNFMVLLATLATLVPYVFSALIPILLRRRVVPSGPRKGPLIPILAFGYSVWMIYGAGAETVLYGFVLLLLGLPVYVWLRLEKREPQVS